MGATATAMAIVLLVERGLLGDEATKLSRPKKYHQGDVTVMVKGEVVEEEYRSDASAHSAIHVR